MLILNEARERRYYNNLYAASFSPDQENQDLNKDPKRKKHYSYSLFLDNLSYCGLQMKVTCTCKKCLAEKRQDPTSNKNYIKQTCGNRYCNHIHCQLTRFARIYTSLRSIKRIKDLRKMWHFSIGFSYIDIIYFKEKRKEFDKIIAAFFRRVNKRLNKAGITKIQAFKFLDFTKSPDSTYFMHYHFLAIPYNFQQQRKIMRIFQEEKQNFHLEVFGNKNKLDVLAYMAKRTAGLFKEKDDPIDFKRCSLTKLKDQIESGKFMLFSDFLDPELFFTLFHKQRLYAVVGGMPYGTILVYSNTIQEPFICPFHGILARKDYKMEFDTKKPPDRALGALEPLQVTHEKVIFPTPKYSPRVKEILDMYAIGEDGEPIYPYHFRVNHLQGMFDRYMRTGETFKKQQDII